MGQQRGNWAKKLRVLSFSRLNWIASSFLLFTPSFENVNAHLSLLFSAVWPLCVHTSFSFWGETFCSAAELEHADRVLEQQEFSCVLFFAFFLILCFCFESGGFRAERTGSCCGGHGSCGGRCLRWINFYSQNCEGDTCVFPRCVCVCVCVY